MAQAVNRQHLTVDTWFRALVNPCGICGEKSGSETSFSPSSLAFPRQYHSTVALHAHIMWG
jgi:hypothetical protein